MKKIHELSLVAILSLLTFNAFAQTGDWYLRGELWARGEYRNGYKTLNTDSSKAAYIVDQRTRIGILHESQRVDFYMALQDARTWGVSGANSIGLYEGWLRWNAVGNFNITLGRQEISFDRQRILGGRNWAAAGLTHDGIRFSINGDNGGGDDETAGLYWQTQVGATYNQNGNLLFAQPLGIPDGYRTMQFFWGKFSSYGAGYSSAFHASILAMNLGLESAIDNKLYFEQTMGGQVSFDKGKLFLIGDGYVQTGRSTLQEPILAWTAGFSASYEILDRGSSNNAFIIKLGTDFLSGTATDGTATKDNSFRPPFGTNHGIYGLMDYFYVGVGHGEGGFWDNYASLKFGLGNTGLSFNLDYHYFRSPQAYAGFNSSLGHELDFTFSWRPENTPNLMVRGGYSQMLGSNLMEVLKSNGRADRYNGWAWLMIQYSIWAKLNVER